MSKDPERIQELRNTIRDLITRNVVTLNTSYPAAKNLRNHLKDQLNALTRQRPPAYTWPQVTGLSQLKVKDLITFGLACQLLKDGGIPTRLVHPNDNATVASTPRALTSTTPSAREVIPVPTAPTTRSSVSAKPTIPKAAHTVSSASNATIPIPASRLRLSTRHATPAPTVGNSTPGNDEDDSIYSDPFTLADVESSITHTTPQDGGTKRVVDDHQIEAAQSNKVPQLTDLSGDTATSSRAAPQLSTPIDTRFTPFSQSLSNADLKRRLEMVRCTLPRIDTKIRFEINSVAFSVNMGTNDKKRYQLICQTIR